jgi:hypothetical protein
MVYAFSNQKNPIWVIFGGSYNGRGWYILKQVGLFCDKSVYFMAIWYILLPFGIFSHFGMLYLKYLATLALKESHSECM